MSDAKTIAELEADIERKKEEQRKALESPFANVGNAVVKRGPGRPPKEELDFTTAEAAHEQRLREIKRPAENTSKEEKREWFENELYDTLPDIAANIKWNIKFGDSKSRAEAETKALKILGLESKDIGNLGKGGQIVINMNGPANTLDIPLLKPVMQTVEAEVVKKKDGIK